jgi:broad specificity phosphatase PhoE
MNGKFLVVVRHGERLDMLDQQDIEKRERPFRNEYDTPLTKNGFWQAFETGKYISNALLSKLKSPTVHLLSSPFCRCL